MPILTTYIPIREEERLLNPHVKGSIPNWYKKKKKKKMDRILTFMFFGLRKTSL